jgi:predicted PurR-regulated permease PerM
MEKIDKNLKITISSGTIIKIIVISVLAFLLYKVLDLVLVVLTAVVIASAVEPIIKWFGRYKIRRLPAVIITYLSVVLIFLGLLYFFIPPVLNEASNLLNNIPQYLDSVTLWNPLNDNKFVETSKITSGISAGLNESKEIIGGLSQGSLQPSVLGDLILKFRDITSDASVSLVKIASRIFGGAFSFILIIVLSFYLVVQEGGVEKFLRIVTPVKNEVYIID